MADAFGILSWVGGKPVLTPEGAGGVFVGLYTFDNFDTAATKRFTFTDLDGMNIFPVLVGSNYHDWVKGVDGSGYPYIEAPPYAVPTWNTWPAGTFNTKIGVFAK